MNLSGILVVAKPDHLPQVLNDLGDLDGVEVHQVDADGGRIVIVQEADDIRAEMAGLRQIKTLPHVIMAEMVYHYIADDNDVYEGLPPELQESACETEACAVPAYLQD